MSAPAGVAKGESPDLFVGSRGMTMRARSSSGIGFVAAGIARAITASVALLIVFVVLAAVAADAEAAPEFDVEATHPADLVPGGTGSYMVSLSNIGDAAMPDGSATVTMTLPEGLTAVSAGDTSGVGIWACSIGAIGREVTCTGPENFGLGIAPGQDACQSFGVTVRS